MGLAKNVYRRQATYWWRRRFADPSTGRSRTIAISLRVRRPDAARRIGDALNARAYAVAKRLEMRMSSIENVRQELTDIVGTFTWTLDEGAAAALDVLAARGTGDPADDHTLTREQEHDLLSEMKREAEAELARSAAFNRLQRAVDGARDPRREAIETELAFAVVFEAVARGGAAAMLDERQRAALKRRFSTDMVAFIEREIAFHAKRESSMRWSLGPPRGYFEDKIRAIAVVPTTGMIRMLRHDYLVLFAALLERAERRYGTPPLTGILRGLDDDLTPIAGGDVSAVALAAVVSAQPAPIEIVAPPAAQPDPPPPVVHAPEPVNLPLPGQVALSFMALVETLIRQKTRAENWHVKTGNQHRSVARLFVKVVGSDDPRNMRQEHIAHFRALLDDLPKNWGKSPADFDRSIEEICARAQDLDDDEVGLAPGTIDRQLTQLSNILAFLLGYGFAIGEVTAAMRTGGANRPRGVFSIDELTALFTSPVYTGCAGAADRLSAGDEIIHDALYWMPILGHHELGRLAELSGLMIDDIDFEREAIIFRDNAIRKLKSECAHRRQPLVPEVRRLGFIDYCRDMRDAGHAVVFPCLQARGERTPMSNLFYKDYKKLLNHVLPLAGAQRKSFHSERKAGNTCMVNGNVNDPIRHAVMGHAHTGTNEQHYLDAVHDEAKLLALSTIPVVTAHLAPYVCAAAR